jgi:hypothetical protein
MMKNIIVRDPSLLDNGVYLLPNFVFVTSHKAKEFCSFSYDKIQFDTKKSVVIYFKNRLKEKLGNIQYTVSRKEFTSLFSDLQ